MKKPLLWTVILLFSLLIAAVAGEILLRLLQNKDAGSAGSELRYIQHGCHYTYRPNSRFDFINEDKRVIDVVSDGHGLRNPSGLFDQADLWLLGDSFITAANTAREQTLAAQIGAYNAGMDGFSTSQSISLLRALLASKTPRQVILAFYLGNDFRDNLLAAEGMAGAPATSMQSGLCGASRLCLLLYTKFYLGLIQGQSTNPMASYALAEMSVMRNTPTPSVEAALASTSAALNELVSLSREKGFSVLVIGIPSKAQAVRSLHEISGFTDDPRAKDFALEIIATGYSFDRPDRLLRMLCTEAGLPHLSLLPPFQMEKDRGLYYQIDPHWTVTGQELAAREIGKVLARSFEADPPARYPPP